MTKLTAALAAALLALSLAACTSPVETDAPDDDPPASSAGADDPIGDVAVDRDPQGPLPTVSFDADGLPTLAAVAAEPPSVITVATLRAGEGATIGADDLVTVDYAGFLWSDGTEFDSSFGTGEPSSQLLGDVMDGWVHGLPGAKVGDRLLLVVPPEYGFGDLEDELIPANSTLVYLIDVLDTRSISTDALTQAEPTGAALPTGLTITGALGEQPSLVYAPGAPEPTEEQLIVLAKGKGPVITENDTLLYHVTSGYWLEESLSTWSESLEQMEAGGTEETIGQTVGSRLLLVYPVDTENDYPAEAVVLDLVATIPAPSE